MKAVNLLPHEELANRSLGIRDPVLFGGLTLATVVVVGMAGSFLLEHSQSGSTQQELTAAQRQLAEAQAREQHQQRPGSHVKLLPLPSVTSQEQPWRTAVASAMSTRIAFDRLLKEFGQVVPSDVTVSDLTMGAPGVSASAASGTSTTTSTSTSTNGVFSLTGTTFSEDSVARLLSRLMLLPDLTNVSLTNSTADQSGVVTFEIAAQVKGAGSSTPSTSPTSSASTTTTSTEPSE